MSKNLVGSFKFSFLFVAPILALLLSACIHTTHTPLRIGSNVWLGYEPLFLARHRKLLPEREFQLAEFTNATEVIRAFRNRSIDVATLTLDEALSIWSRGSDLKIIAITDFSNGADVVLSKKPLRTLSDIKGKRIAAETTALGAYMLSRLLDAAKLKRTDVTTVPIPVEQQPRAYEANQADLFISFYPDAQRLMDLGAHVIYDSHRIPGEIVDVLLTTPAVLESHCGEIKRLLSAWFTALEEAQNPSPETFAILSQRTKLKSSDVEKALHLIAFPSLAQHQALLWSDTPTIKNTAEALYKSMQRAGILNTDESKQRSLAPIFEGVGRCAPTQGGAP